MSKTRDFTQEIETLNKLLQQRQYGKVIKRVSDSLRLPTHKANLISRKDLAEVSQYMNGVTVEQRVNDKQSFRQLNLENAELYSLRAKCYELTREPILAFQDERSAYRLSNGLKVQSLRDIVKFTIFDHADEVELEAIKKNDPGTHELMANNNITQTALDESKKPAFHIWTQGVKRKISFNTTDAVYQEESPPVSPRKRPRIDG